MDRETLEALHQARASEKQQALFYRVLASHAETDGDADLSARIHDLHADEQHHLSRITARLLELGELLVDLRAISAPAASLEHWERVAREREAAEVERYRSLLERTLDDATRAVLEEILYVDRKHGETLTGKWTGATPGGSC